MLTHSQNMEQEQEDHGIHIERCTVYKKLNLLEGIYIHLLGNDFRYRMGIQVFCILSLAGPRLPRSCLFHRSSSPSRFDTRPHI